MRLIVLLAIVGGVVVAIVGGCSSMKEYSACYVFVWNAHVVCWPDHEPMFPIESNDGRKTP